MQASAVISGDRIVRPLDPVIDEIESLRRENARLLGMLAEAESLADSDSLTPLVNRRCLIREIDRAAEQRARYAIPAAFLYADMNGLKTINDHYGHAVGDAALLHLADILLNETRASDLIARIGGDEFGVLLAYADEAATAQATARLAAAIATTPLSHRGLVLPIGLAIGSTVIAADDTAEAVLARADAAMYAAKSAQRSDR
jgi:diguanylate cyclase (GGDEF)-like protein